MNVSAVSCPAPTGIRMEDAAAVGAGKVWRLLFFFLGFTWLFIHPATLWLLSLFPVIYCRESLLLRRTRHMAGGFLVVCGLFLILLIQMTLAQLWSVVQPIAEELQPLPGLAPFIKNAAKLCLNLFGAYTFYRFFQRRHEGSFCLRCFVLGFDVFLLVMLTFAVVSVPLFVGALKTVGVTSAAHLHNSLGFKLLTALCLVMASMPYHASRAERARGTVTIAVCVLLTIFTFSRASMLAVAVGLSFALLLNAKRMLLVAVLVLFVAALIGLSPERLLSILPDRLVTRYSVATAMADKGSGRLEVWADYFEYAALTDWFLGRGYNTPPEPILDQRPLRNQRHVEIAVRRFDEGINKTIPPRAFSPHNTYISLFLNLGALALGALVFLGWLLWRLTRDAVGGRLGGVYVGILTCLLVHFLFEIDLLEPSVHFILALLLSRVHAANTKGVFCL